VKPLKKREVGKEGVSHVRYCRGKGGKNLRGGHSRGNAGEKRRQLVKEKNAVRRVGGEGNRKGSYPQGEGSRGCGKEK